MRIQIKKSKKVPGKWVTALILDPYIDFSAIHVGYFSSQPDALKAGYIAYRFANTKIAWHSKTRIVR